MLSIFFYSNAPSDFLTHLFLIKTTFSVLPRMFRQGQVMLLNSFRKKNLSRTFNCFYNGRSSLLNVWVYFFNELFYWQPEFALTYILSWEWIRFLRHLLKKSQPETVKSKRRLTKLIRNRRPALKLIYFICLYWTMLFFLLLLF